MPLIAGGVWLLVRIWLTVRHLPAGRPPSPALAFLFFTGVMLVVLPVGLLTAVWARRRVR